MSKEELLHPNIEITNIYYQSRLRDLIYGCHTKEEAELLAFGIIRLAKETREDGWEKGYKEGTENLQLQLKGILNIYEPPKQTLDSEE